MIKDALPLAIKSRGTERSEEENLKLQEIYVKVNVFFTSTA